MLSSTTANKTTRVTTRWAAEIKRGAFMRDTKTGLLGLSKMFLTDDGDTRNMSHIVERLP